MTPKPAPSISVVMSVFNGARYLSEAVESILCQSYRDFEWIIVNDGSTDDSLKICRSYAAQDRRIQLIDQKHKGLTYSLNRGVSLARGEFVARMDADDIAERHRFKIQLKFMHEHPTCVALGSRLLLIDADGDPLAEHKPPQSHDDIVAELFTGCGAIPHPSAMLRAQSLRSVGAYREEFICAQDLDLWLRLSEIGQLANVDDQLLRCRVHGKSTTIRRRELQLSCSRRAVSDAYRRCGKSLPSDFQMPGPFNESWDSTLRTWASMALRAGNIEVARKHAWSAFRASPFSLRNVGLATKLLAAR